MDGDHERNNIKTCQITHNTIKRNHKEQRRFHSVLKDKSRITEIILILCSGILVWCEWYILYFIYIFFYFEKSKMFYLCISFIFEVNNKWVHMYLIIVLLTATYAFLNMKMTLSWILFWYTVCKTVLTLSYLRALL